MNDQDVIIIGGGIAGLSAAIYTAQAGLPTIVFDSGKSQIKPISKVYNYPGFPEGIEGETLVAKMREQAVKFGAVLSDYAVTATEQVDGKFRVVSGNGEKLTSTYLVVASNVNLQPLEDLGIETEVSPAVPSGKISRVTGGSWNGETGVDNLYVAGLLSGVPTQSIIAAGQGTQVAMEIITKEKGKAHVWHDS
ncbi:NAD(P)/FAD-dependent oxidoreductase [Salisediminibacterium beveridgei]|uniref:Thioredoxin reductase n=1 Tax=Salisediminibacterium beveridgei TaxID=632773 RepID=A0A1D7QY62_9BACI|nr:FAD-dependent oxidoreductase [Salisediminibacterium beveridgei]AOM83947.1 Thioredoxin reductase [Salisediminibacterium beveridgei]